MYTFVCVDIFWNDAQEAAIIVTLEISVGRTRGFSFLLDTFLYYLTCLQQATIPLTNEL